MKKKTSKFRQAIEHIRNTRDYLLHKRPAGRLMTVRPGDLFIVSYPKSGNTWTRFLLGNLLYPNEEMTFSNIEYRIPSIYNFSDRQLLRLPRVFKSHDCFDPRYKQVICIVRDPRDVTVSAYHYSIKVGILPENCPIQDFVPQFMSGEFGAGLLANPRWGSWYINVGSWLAMRQHLRFLLLRYEDMLAEPVTELARVAEFLHMDVTPERLNRAVELSSAKKMRKMETEQSKDWNLTKNSRQDKPFVRAAKKGSWRDELPAESVALIESGWGDLMLTLGYEITTQPASSSSIQPQTAPETGHLLS